MTNFATFIDSANDRAPIAQRGKAKQKRTDLRLVGLALVVTRDGGVPLVSHAYPGNRPDVTQFAAVIDELVARYRRPGRRACESLTVVFDAGQNSRRQPRAGRGRRGIGFVGSLPPSDHPDLLAIPARRYRAVDPDRFPGLTAVDTTVTALGVTRRAVLTHSPTLHAKQSRGLRPDPGQGPRPLAELAGPPGPRPDPPRPRRGRRPRSPRSCKPRWVAEVLTATLTGDHPAELRLSWRTDTTRPASAWKSGCSANGSCSPTATTGPSPTSSPPTAPNPTPSPASASSKTPTWSRSPRCPLDRPEDPRARLLLRARPDHRPPDAPPSRPGRLHLSVRELLDHLAGIQETVLLYHDGGKGRPRARRMLTDMSPTQQRLSDLFGLHRYAPTR